ncbi:GLPGLI family protein [Elizabethkingia anophelis]|uniref:GLPGLI family protein n=1 Tax=Elizabethkingia anophelis TaxID=1117645 RepID=UPI003891ADF1
MKFIQLLLAFSFICLKAQFSTVSGNFTLNSDPYSAVVLDKSFQNIYYMLNFVKKPRETDKKTEVICVLQLGKDYSKFSDLNKLRRDSLMEKLSHKVKINADDMNKMLRLRNHWENVLVKNIPEQKNIHQEDMAEDFQYEEKQPVFEWKIENDTKDILGYNCRKAITQYRGRKYTAWYATDIPINNGPYVFQGLPGLIMEIEDQKQHYHFIAIAMDKKASEIYLRNEDKIFHVDRKRFRKVQKSYHDNPGFFYSGAYDKDGTSVKLKAKPYNPIELE